VKIRTFTKTTNPKGAHFLSMNEANFTEANVCHCFYSLTL